MRDFGEAPRRSSMSPSQ